jgi:hypothetical protein
MRPCFPIRPSCRTAILSLTTRTTSNVTAQTRTAAIGLTGIGWLLVSVAILRGKTDFPRFFGFLTPLPLSVFFILIYYAAPAIIPDALAGAVFNVAAVFCFRTAAAPPEKLAP